MADKRIRIELNVDEELGGLTRAQSALDQFSRRGTAAFGRLETHVAGLERAAPDSRRNSAVTCRMRCRNYSPACRRSNGRSVGSAAP